MLHSKRSPLARKFSEDGPLSFFLSITATDFLRERLKGQSVLAVGCHSAMHMCMDDASIAITWAVSRNKIVKDYNIKKELKQVSKKISKRNLVHVGMVQCMNALAH